MLTNTAGRGTEMKTTLVCLKAVLKKMIHQVTQDCGVRSAQRTRSLQCSHGTVFVNVSKS